MFGGSSLNDLGVVVGYSDAGGWIWDASDGTQLLNNLVPAGWDVAEALSISDNGLILAQASFDGGPLEYVELDPAPEPRTYSLVGVGLLLLGFARRATLRRQ